MECNKDENLKSCNCTYEPCHRKDLSCECYNTILTCDSSPAAVFPRMLRKHSIDHSNDLHVSSWITGRNSVVWIVTIIH
jgi:hypothetical protein